jgi:hypothetical protein
MYRKPSAGAVGLAFFTTVFSLAAAFWVKLGPLEKWRSHNG